MWRYIAIGIANCYLNELFGWLGGDDAGVGLEEGMDEVEDSLWDFTDTISSHASTKSPTPSSSTSSKQPVKNLAEELKGVPITIDSDDEVTLKKETYDKLQYQVKKGDEDITKIQEIYNSTTTKLQGLKQIIQELSNRPQRLADLENRITHLGGQSSNSLIQKLQNEVNTLQAAANIITTPTRGRQKLKLSSPITYNSTQGQLKSFLIQIQTYQNFHHSNFTNQTEKEEFLKCKTLDEYSTETHNIYSSFQRFENALQSLFQDPDERRQTERNLTQLQQTKSAKEYAATFKQLSVQLNLTKETKIFMFYQELKDDIKDEIVKLDKPKDFLQYANIAIKIDNQLFKRRKEKGEKRQRTNSRRKYQ
ncbi:hypothetical protein GQ607_017776 [Colletotrichum asianum]|uniref:Retrotransposon gag domain-containing protein n=1 Tax=Colletotrichum asianum TaxID=702518 RepID=A0A8H3ZD05_9PEZI|nr:hypothetical protein GQ607_017776 [Colletotrichum asianum]